ncbi:hypothetical protein BDQ94DRAFT_163822 [Aspergillus welwitschiae]|uniref:Uncharacterized protein n=1 Tax=Aspergillus welwitschiae TaxID=1341132 RepID=A0A3F3PJW1_9EURO|nr:hypothetical protein BDQ94DRAFT_163822 [Aspergillus welwitschiae]RDH27234.1 hypothetical protein BDQ94DRAFT_163822 [Aspergillus welwitschiae]
MEWFDANCCVLLWGWVTSPREQCGKSLCDARSGEHPKDEDTEPDGNNQKIAPSQDEEIKTTDPVTPSRGPHPSWNFCSPRETICVCIIATHKCPQLVHGTRSGARPRSSRQATAIND